MVNNDTGGGIRRIHGIEVGTHVQGFLLFGSNGEDKGHVWTEIPDNPGWVTIHNPWYFRQRRNTTSSFCHNDWRSQVCSYKETQGYQKQREGVTIPLLERNQGH